MNTQTQTKTQTDTILEHLNKHGKITSATAIGVYGITRLASVIDKLVKKGVKIDRRYFKGFRAPRVAEYSLSSEVTS